MEDCKHQRVSKYCKGGNKWTKGGLYDCGLDGHPIMSPGHECSKCDKREEVEA